MRPPQLTRRGFVFMALAASGHWSLLTTLSSQTDPILDLSLCSIVPLRTSLRSPLSSSPTRQVFCITRLQNLTVHLSTFDYFESFDQKNSISTRQGLELSSAKNQLYEQTCGLSSDTALGTPVPTRPIIHRPSHFQLREHYLHTQHVRKRRPFPHQLRRRRTSPVRSRRAVLVHLLRPHLSPHSPLSDVLVS